MSRRSLHRLFAPRRVAVVGASEREGSAGAVLWRNLAGFPGDVVPVSRTATTVGGVRAFPSLGDAPGPIDLAVVAVPARLCLDVVADAAAAGVGAVVLISAGFAETGESGRALQDECVAVARAGGVILVGPNCLGVQNLRLGLNASLASGTARPGGISVITQSGAYAMALSAICDDDGVGFATAYSSGNRADLGDHQVLEHLLDDAGTEVVAAFLESVAHGPEFLDALRRTARAKPVVVTAVGRSPAGARSAASHTAALAKDRRVWDDVLTSAGATVTRSGLEMLDAARAMATRPLPAGRRVAIVTNSGGTATELADLLAAEGLEVPVLSAALQERLRALLPDYGSPANPVDLTPVWSRYAELYPAVSEEIARSREVDVVIPLLVHRAAEDPSVADSLASAAARLRDEGSPVALQVCWVGPQSASVTARTLQEAGIPCFAWPGRAARALGHAVRRAEWSRSLTGASAGPGVPTARVRGATAPLPTAPEEQGPEKQWELLRDRGLPVAETWFCASADEAVRAAQQVGYPVVVKVVHPSLSHKSDVDGVRIGLRTAPEVEHAAAMLLRLAAGARLCVQRQHHGSEIAVGAIRDDTFGAVVAVGLGGVLVELLGDFAFAPVPLDAATADALLARSRIEPLLGGWRGSPPPDRKALVDLVVKVGDLMAEVPTLTELDLNPVLISPEGCLVVDVRLVGVDDSSCQTQRGGVVSSSAVEVPSTSALVASGHPSNRRKP